MWIMLIDSIQFFYTLTDSFRFWWHKNFYSLMHWNFMLQQSSIKRLNRAIRKHKILLDTKSCVQRLHLCGFLLSIIKNHFPKKCALLKLIYTTTKNLILCEETWMLIVWKEVVWCWKFKFQIDALIREISKSIQSRLYCKLDFRILWEVCEFQVVDFRCLLTIFDPVLGWNGTEN
jgi:hypothetical protein